MSLRPPRFCARLFQRRAGRPAAHIAAPAAACAATTPPQAPTPHYMIMVAAHARQFHSRRPVAGALGPLDSEIAAFNREFNGWSLRRPVEHVCTAAAPPPRVVRLPRVPRVRATPRNLADLLVASARRARRLLRRLRPRAPQPPLLLQSLPTAPARRFAMVNAGSTPVPNPPSPPPSTLLARSAAPPRRSAPSTNAGAVRAPRWATFACCRCSAASVATALPSRPSA